MVQLEDLELPLADLVELQAFPMVLTQEHFQLAHFQMEEAEVGHPAFQQMAELAELADMGQEVEEEAQPKLEQVLALEALEAVDLQSSQPTSNQWTIFLLTRKLALLKTSLFGMA
jgi:hypothetical protein